MSRRQPALLTLDVGDEGLIVTEWCLDSAADEQLAPAARTQAGEPASHPEPERRPQAR